MAVCTTDIQACQDNHEGTNSLSFSGERDDSAPRFEEKQGTPHINHHSICEIGMRVQQSTRFVVFCGETLSKMTKGRLPAPLHYVDETIMGECRISAPFFVRAVRNYGQTS